MLFSRVSVGGGITDLETIISATKIRINAKKKYGINYIKVLSKIKVNDLKKIENK